MENAKSLNLTKLTINVTSQLVLFASKLQDIKVIGALVDGSPYSQVLDEKHDEAVCVDNCIKDFFCDACWYRPGFVMPLDTWISSKAKMYFSVG